MSQQVVQYHSREFTMTSGTVLGCPVFLCDIVVSKWHSEVYVHRCNLIRVGVQRYLQESIREYSKVLESSSCDSGIRRPARLSWSTVLQRDCRTREYITLKPLHSAGRPRPYTVLNTKAIAPKALKQWSDAMKWWMLHCFNFFAILKRFIASLL